MNLIKSVVTDGSTYINFKNVFLLNEPNLFAFFHKCLISVALPSIIWHLPSPSCQGLL